MIPEPRQILCIGSVLWDIIGRTRENIDSRGDVPGQITRLPGGVALNIAMTLARFGVTPVLLSAVGEDPEGHELIAAVRALGCVTDLVHRMPDLPTDAYMAIEGPGGLVAAIADAHSLEKVDDAILAPLADGRLGSAQQPYEGIIALDGNLTADLLGRIAVSPLFARAKLRIAPASPGKAERLLPIMGHAGTTLYVNRQEAGYLCGHSFDDSRSAAEGLIAAGAARVLVTDGPRDSSDAMRGAETLTLPARAIAVRRVTGAGDTFMAAHLLAEGAGMSRLDGLAHAQETAARYVANEEDHP
ncbi:MAG: PfkB family carbohydrate kinase [Paracoccaceae bacterium]